MDQRATLTSQYSKLKHLNDLIINFIKSQIPLHLNLYYLIMESSSSPDLFTPILLGDLLLPNRIVCAALGRGRGDLETKAPTAMHAEAYSQRATSALMFTECSAVSQDGDSYIGSANFYSEE